MASVKSRLTRRNGREVNVCDFQFRDPRRPAEASHRRLARAVGTYLLTSVS